MKRGPKKDSNKSSKKAKIDAKSKASIARIKAEHALKDSPFAKLVDDATKVIFNNLPEYSFIGDNSVNLVCHYFNTLTNEYKTEYKREITKEKLLKNCRDEIDALNILKDSAICDELSIKEILGVASFVPEIIEALLKWDKFNSTAYKQLLLALGTKNLQAAKKLIENKVKRKYYCVRHVDDYYGMLAPFQYEISAEYVHKKDRTRSYDNPNYIDRKVEIGKYHAKLAYEIIEEFGDRLTEYNLIDLAEHFEVFSHFMNNAHLRAKMSKMPLFVLGCKNYKVVEYISNNPELRSMFGDFEYSCMQYIHPEVFNENVLLELVKVDKDVAYNILLNLSLKSKELAFQILSRQEFVELFHSSDLKKILSAHEELRRQIMNKTFTLPSLAIDIILGRDENIAVIKVLTDRGVTENIPLDLNNDDIPLRLLGNPQVEESVSNSDEHGSFEEHRNITLLNFIKQISKELDPADILERQMRSQLTL